MADYGKDDDSPAGMVIPGGYSLLPSPLRVLMAIWKWNGISTGHHVWRTDFIYRLSEM